MDFYEEAFNKNRDTHEFDASFALGWVEIIKKLIIDDRFSEAAYEYHKLEDAVRILANLHRKAN